MKKIEISPSMKLASVWGVWAFLAVGALGWALFIVLKAFDAVKDASSWVQAFGSVFAIFAAVWVASSQSRQLQAQQHRKNVVLLKSLQVLSARAFRVCEGLINYNPNNELSSDSLIRGLRKSFDGINILELPDPKVIDMICSIRDCMQEIQERLVDESDDAKKVAYASSRRLTLILATVMVAANELGRSFNEINNSLADDHPEHISLMRPGVRTAVPCPASANTPGAGS